MAPLHFFMTLFLIFGTILAVFAMKYTSAASAARARVENDAAYRLLAERGVAAQVESQAAISAMQVEVAKAVASLAAIEKVLKQVE